MNIDGRYTCFYHRILDFSHPVSGEVNPEKRSIHPAEIDLAIKKKSTTDDQHISVAAEDRVAGLHHTSNLLTDYLHHYAFAWWASVGLLALSIIMWMKMMKKSGKKKSEFASQ
jgi:hypothetical protein